MEWVSHWCSRFLFFLLFFFIGDIATSLVTNKSHAVRSHNWLPTKNFLFLLCLPRCSGFVCVSSSACNNRHSARCWISLSSFQCISLVLVCFHRIEPVGAMLANSHTELVFLTNYFVFHLLLWEPEDYKHTRVSQKKISLSLFTSESCWAFYAESRSRINQVELAYAMAWCLLEQMRDRIHFWSITRLCVKQNAKFMAMQRQTTDPSPRQIIFLCWFYSTWFKRGTDNFTIANSKM